MLRAGTGEAATTPQDANGTGPDLPGRGTAPAGEPAVTRGDPADPDAADRQQRGQRDGVSAAVPASDAELLRQHVSGDAEAFGLLFLRHRDRLWAVAIRTLADPEEAADALQDAMISAFRRAGSFRGESAVTTWLHRIVVNSCLDRMRRRAARPVTARSDEQSLDTLALGSAVPDPASDTDTSLDVLVALRQLPRDQQAALVLVDMLGYPVADAADVLGVAPGTVKSRCARGRARLAPRLAHLRKDDQAKDTPADPPAAVTSPGGNRSAAGSVLPPREGGDTAP
jgi:RNA polymerase sigma-70 factor, ECF subfamily